MDSFLGVLPWLLVVIQLAAIVHLMRLYQRQCRQTQIMVDARQEMVSEEQRIFDFLHGLGNLLMRDQSTASMHRYMVEGVMGVLKAQGGCLYVMDASQSKLVPSFISEHSPPLIDLPERIAVRARTDPATLTSFLRLHSVTASGGLLGSVLAGNEPLLIDDLRRHPLIRSAHNAPSQQGASVMIAPLQFADHVIGVLAACRTSSHPRFTEDDFTIFRSVAEQCAFALGNSMAHREAEDKRRLEREMQSASEIQRLLLPRKAPALSDFDIAGTSLPARYVSGDYFDYIAVDKNHYGVAIGDVSGKGVAASLIMAMCRSVLRFAARGNLSAASALFKVNRIVCPDIREDKFISLAYVILEKDSDEIAFARAGHDPPLLYRADSGEIEEINPPGLALGIDEGEVFERVLKDRHLRMKPGDTLLLYTDGVTEAVDLKGLEFGLERLKEALRQHVGHGAKALVSAVREEVLRFMRGHPPHDDITLIAIEKR